jgi:hypothetical protein
MNTRVPGPMPRPARKGVRQIPGNSQNGDSSGDSEGNTNNGHKPLPATCMRPEPYWWEVDCMDWWADTWT